MKGGSIIMADWDHWGGREQNRRRRRRRGKKDRDVTAEVLYEME